MRRKKTIIDDHPWFPQSVAPGEAQEAGRASRQKVAKKRLASWPSTILMCRGCGELSYPEGTERFNSFMIPHAAKCFGVAFADKISNCFDWIEVKEES